MTVLFLAPVTAVAFAWLQQHMNISGYKSMEKSPSLYANNCVFYCTIESNSGDDWYFLYTIQNQKVSTKGFVRYSIKSTEWE